MIGEPDMKSLKQCADLASAIYANKFYVRMVDGGVNVKLAFFEESPGGQITERSAVLLSRENAEALLQIASDVLQAGNRDDS